MDRSRPELLGAVAWPLYAIAALLILHPLVDFLSTVWPISLGSVQWRYGAIGMSSGFYLTPMLALAMAMAAAAVLHHHAVLRSIGVISGVFAAVLLLAGVSLVLDMLELRIGVTEEALPQFDLGVWMAELKIVTAAPVLAWLARVGWRAGKTAEKPKQVPAAPLMRPAVSKTED